MPFAPSSFLFLVVMPGASSSFLAPSSDALRSSLTRTAFVADGELRLYCVDHGDLFLLEPDLPESEICNSKLFNSQQHLNRPNGPPTALRSEAARLLSPLPHVGSLALGGDIQSNSKASH